MAKKNRLLVSILFFLVFATNSYAAKEDIRCAFDIGSGETKLSIARLIKAKTGSKVSVEKLETKTVRVPIKKSVKDGILPEETIQALIQKLQEFKEACVNAGATRFSGVATSGFRAASVNGQKAIERVSKETGISLRIVTGDEEAVLGLLAAESNYDDLNEKERPTIIAWDIGGGSMQFATRNPKKNGSKFLVVSISLGAEVYIKELRNLFNRDNTSPTNPLTSSEMEQAIEAAHAHAAEIPQELRAILKKKGAVVVGIGSTHQKGIAKPVGVRVDENSRGYYEIDSVVTARSLAIDCSDECFTRKYPENDHPQNEASILALVSGLMEELNVEKVYPIDVNLTDGLFRDSDAWTAR